MNLILIGASNTYTPYVDGKRGESAQFSRPLDADEVEEFRKNPDDFFGNVEDARDDNLAHSVSADVVPSYTA